MVEAVAHHHAPEKVVRQTTFDTLAATAIAHALTGLGDAGSFRVALRPDAKVNASYLESVHAPFDLAEAQRRIDESLKAEESLV